MMNKFLEEAILDGYEAVVEGLIADHPQWLEARNRDGATPLLLAASAPTYNVRFSGCIRVLIEAGANVNAATESGYTPLMSAVSVEFRDLESIRLLIEAGADVNAKTSEGYSILHQAVADHGYVYSEYCAKASDFFPWLVEAGADLEAVNHHGFTPLMLAMIDGGTSDVRALLAVGANPDAIVPNTGHPVFNEGQNMLSLAWYHHHAPQAMQALIDAGADVNQRDAHGRTALEYMQAIDIENFRDSKHYEWFRTKRLSCIEVLQRAMESQQKSPTK